ncbi:MAG: glycosyltransferase [Limisphaerales bacterium]
MNQTQQETGNASSSVAAVVVTYRPDDSIIGYVRRISEQTSKIVVVDNASDGASVEWIEALAKIPGVFLIRNRANLGIAAALNLGIRQALQSPCSWVATFDQDTGIPPRYFDRLLEVYQKCPFRDKVGMVAPGGWTEAGKPAAFHEPQGTRREGGDHSHPSPSIPLPVEGRGKMLSGATGNSGGSGGQGANPSGDSLHEPHGPSPHPGPLPSHPMGAERESQADASSHSKARQDTTGSGAEAPRAALPREWSFASGAITSGSLIKPGMFEAVGFYDEALFIDYVDSDFCLRLQKRGFKIMSVAPVRLEHELGGQETRHFAGFTISFRVHVAWRYYYNFRNRLLLYRRYGMAAPGWFLRDVSWLILELGRIFLLESGRGPKIRAAFLGLKDGLLGRSGRHPDFPPPRG